MTSRTTNRFFWSSTLKLSPNVVTSSVDDALFAVETSLRMSKNVDELSFGKMSYALQSKVSGNDALKGTTMAT